MKEFTFIGTLRADGRSSVKVVVTKAADALELKPGDYVEVTVRRVKE